MKKIVFLIVESSIETIPKELLNDPLIKKEALKRKKKTSEIILDVSKHYKPMQRHKIQNIDKRGRPDIIHRSLITILDSLLTKSIQTEIYIHTLKDEIIKVSPETRIPRNYNRFIGLFEQLFKHKKVPSNSPKALIEVSNKRVEEIFSDIRTKSGLIIGFSRKGKRLKNSLNYFREHLQKEELIAYVVGGFPIGFFSEKILKNLDEIISLGPFSLTTSATLCRIITINEILLGII